MLGRSAVPYRTLRIPCNPAVPTNSQDWMWKQPQSYDELPNGWSPFWYTDIQWIQLNPVILQSNCKSSSLKCKKWTLAKCRQDSVEEAFHQISMKLVLLEVHGWLLIVMLQRLNKISGSSRFEVMIFRISKPQIFHAKRPIRCSLETWSANCLKARCTNGIERKMRASSMVPRKAGL